MSNTVVDTAVLSTAPPRWEYRVVMFSTGGLGTAAIENMLNELGAEGWEAFHVQADAFNAWIYVKRAVEMVARDVARAPL